jgi:diguanylate cyclase (GGDEF)-like protein
MTDRDALERDGLTGLAARRSFEERWREESEQAAERKGTVSLGFIDIDLFKHYNDAFGHQAGDTVIRNVAEIARLTVGDAGLAARYGGEEFAVLLPGMEKEQAFLLVERIRAAVESRSIEAGAEAGSRLGPGGGSGASGSPARVTVSGGVAAFPTDARTRSEVIRKADHALYRAKATGRNKVCIAQEERMATRTSHFTITQLERLAKLAREEGVGEAVLLREALDDLLTKYKVSDVES